VRWRGEARPSDRGADHACNNEGLTPSAAVKDTSTTGTPLRRGSAVHSQVSRIAPCLTLHLRRTEAGPSAHADSPQTHPYLGFFGDLINPRYPIVNHSLSANSSPQATVYKHPAPPASGTDGYYTCASMKCTADDGSNQDDHDAQ
jgi:hypothetical protein